MWGLFGSLASKIAPPSIGVDIFSRNATKKAAGTSRNGRDSIGRRLGLKKNQLEIVRPGHILIRQRGTKYRAGLNVGLGKDHTLFSLVHGRVFFSDNEVRERKVVNVVPTETLEEAEQQVRQSFKIQFLKKEKN
eukprot:TRINITY_DN2797_c0_g1_i1.p1 TRINITY_DN2797_c0_g1~~TRINITY_DN2797_c0_g1_i1.p1  ORF type:complete len:134 (+),score=45.59 TRINITY_DN2797_c0_g1_i1:91-492(+)